jgi:hypothetical protein
LEHLEIVPKQPFAFHSDSWIRSTTSDCRTIRTTKVQDVCLLRNYMTILLSACAKRTPTVCVTVGCTHIRCGMYSRMSVRVRKTKLRVVGGMSTPRADRLLGLPLTIFRGHMASTFKRLTTTTTHCDLSQIHQHRRGIISTMILHINPVRHPYSDCRDVNIATPISRE